MNSIIDFLSKPETATALNIELGQGIDWFDQLRQRGLQHFQQQGLPTRKHAHWRYTNLTSLTTQAYQTPTPPLNQAVQQTIAAATLPNCHTLVFINGKLDHVQSQLNQLPAGVNFIDFQQSLDHKIIRNGLGHQLELTHFPFAALNTAYMNNGYLLHCEPHCHVDTAIQIISYNEAEADKAHFCFPRQLISLAESAQCQLIMTSLGPIEGPTYFCDPLTEITLQAGATLSLSKTLQESPTAFHLASTHVTLAKQANFNYRYYGWEAATAREEVIVHLDEPHATSDIQGCFYFDKQQQFSFNTQLIHHADNTTSHTHINGLAGGDSRTSFDGRIIAMQEISGIKADLTNQNILLSPSAEMNSNPDLEIYTDDVQCSHGSTIGQLDEDALFYLQTRGLDENTARGLLIHGFLQCLLAAESHEELRAQLTATLSTLTQRGE